MENFFVKSVCIDDFALKKRQRYGTIMVDFDTGRIVDMIETRETEAVAEWLSTFPNVQFVSRDGSQAYAAAITKGLPGAVQISDRFHLMKGICDRGNQCFQRIFKGRIAIPMTSESERRRQILSLGTPEEKARFVQGLSGEGRTISEIGAVTGMANRTVKKYLQMKPGTTKKRETVRGKEHKIAVEKVQARADLVIEMKAGGMGINAIRKKTGFTQRTIKSYLSEEFSPISGHYGKRREGKLYRFREDVLTMRAQGKTYSQIFEVIRGQGFTGTVDAIRGFVSKEQRIVNDLQKTTGTGQSELVEKKWVVQLLFKPLDEIKALSPEQFAAVLKEHPIAKTIFKTVNRFKGILKRRDVDALEKWIDDVAVLEIEELSSFANGLKSDFEAVKNAFLYDYNNGLAEGSVNKVKVIKRVMYGRCSFPLLKNKILAMEASRMFK